MGNLDVSTSSGAKMTSLSSEFAELSGLAKAKFYWPKLSKGRRWSSIPGGWLTSKKCARERNLVS